MSLSSVVANAIADIFDNEDVAVDAVYRPLIGTAFELRAIVSSIDNSNSMLETGSYVEGTRIRVQAANVAEPVEGDKIALDVSLSTPAVQDGRIWSTSSAWIVRRAIPDVRRATFILDVQKVA